MSAPLLEIDERHVGGVTIFGLRMLPAQRGSFAGFQQLIRERLDGNASSFVINLSQCLWIDSQGLGELVRSLVAVMRQGGSLKLAEVPPRLLTILEITNLTQVFEVFDSEAAALKSYEV